MNPEFKRNLWLEISPARLAIMPGVLTLVGLLVVALNQDDPQRSLYVVFSMLFIALTAGWGSVLVVSSINDEVTERTWDQQRLSALGPWPMAWGKLFGSAAYAWYGGALCALVAVLAAATGPAFASRCTWLLVGGIGTVALHAWLMASRLHTMDLRTEKPTGMASRLLGLLLVLQALPLIFMVLRDPQSGERNGTGDWWGLGLPLPTQSLLMACMLLALGLLALWRSMGKQLMLRATPWAWATGVLGLGVLLAGFLPAPANMASVWLSMAGTALVATYFALFTESNNRLVWQAMLFHRARGATPRMLQALPLWPVSFGLAAVLVLLFALAPSAMHAGIDKLGGLVTLVLLHCLRDCGIYHFFALRNTPRKPAGMTLLTLFVLGVVLPGLAATASPPLAQWLEPLFGVRRLLDGSGTLGLHTWTAMALHLLVVTALVRWRWNASAPPQQPPQP